MTPVLARAVGDSMMRARALQQQQQAARVVLQRYAAVEAIAGWAARVVRSDEIGRYNLLFRIAEREA